MLQIQTNLKYLYKLLMWQILTSSNLDPLLTSHFYLLTTIWKMHMPHQPFIKLL